MSLKMSYIFSFVKFDLNGTVKLTKPIPCSLQAFVQLPLQRRRFMNHVVGVQYKNHFLSVSPSAAPATSFSDVSHNKSSFKNF